MDIEKIEKLVALMQDGDLSEIEIEEDAGRIRLSRRVTEPHPGFHIPGPQPHQPANPLAPAAEPSATANTTEEEGFIYVKSPMVGTFYRAPSPDSPPYVEDGSRIKADTVVGIIEAMKVMNEIVAECSGTVVEVLVENGDAIEFGQPLMKIRPR